MDQNYSYEGPKGKHRGIPKTTRAAQALQAYRNRNQGGPRHKEESPYPSTDYYFHPINAFNYPPSISSDTRRTMQPYPMDGYKHEPRGKK